jgi:hypothetical protein
MNSRDRDCHGELFKNLKILPLYSQYMFTPLLLLLLLLLLLVVVVVVVVVKNKDQYKSNQEVHSTNTRYSTNIHPPISNLAALQRGAYYFGMKDLSHLSSIIKTCLMKELI